MGNNNDWEDDMKESKKFIDKICNEKETDIHLIEIIITTKDGEMYKKEI